MRPTRTLAKDQARKAIFKGVNSVYEIVRETFGPEGKNALLFRKMNQGERITNDGVTVSECIIPKNQFVRSAAETFKEACKKTNEIVGDGTTCTTIIGGKLYNEVHSQMQKNAGAIGVSQTDTSPIQLRNKILKEADTVKKELRKQSKQIKTIEELEKIATVSVENEELGKMIASMAWDVGVDGFIDVVEGHKGKIETEVIKGIRFNAKVPDSNFLTREEKFEMVAEDSAVLLTNYKLDNVAQVAEIMNKLVGKYKKVAVLAPGFSEGVLSVFFQANYVLTVDQNGKPIKRPGQYAITPVSIPSLRIAQLDDLAVYFGARFINKSAGDTLDSITEKDLGFVEKLIVKDSERKEEAVATGGAGVRENKTEGKSAVQKRLETLQVQLGETKELQFKRLLERRIASIASSVGIIKVADSTKASSHYIKLKIEDAVFASKAALKSGYVKGGGLALKEIAESLPEDSVLKSAIMAPYDQIQQSSGGKLKIKDNVIDPTDAIYYAVEHATQVVANLITCNSITVELEDPTPETGNLAVARALHSMAITQKIKEGQMKAGQEEQYMDSLGGLNDDEFTLTHSD